MQNLLLLSAGRRVELLQGMQAAARDLLPEATVFCADLCPQRSAACQLAKHALKLPRVGSPEYADCLCEICQQYAIGLVVPTIDTELATLAMLRGEFLERGTHLVVSDHQLIARCRDKRTTGELFRQLQVATPRLYEPDSIHFPCFSKFYDGSNSVGACRLNAEAELTPTMRREPKRIYQELVPETYREFTVDLYYDRRGQLIAIVPRERLEVRGGEVSKGITRRNWIYEYLLDRFRSLEGARGCLTLQLFAGREGEVLAIEINPRFGGGYPLALAAGADFPRWLILEYLLGQSISFFDAWEPNLMMLRYDAKVLVREHD